MSLQSQLDSFLIFFRSRVPAKLAGILDKSCADRCVCGTAASTRKPGDFMPDINLPDVNGRFVSVADQVLVGPAVVMFYRGGWCPYCNITLRAYQAVLGEIHAEGAKVYAISPQTVAMSRATADKNGLTFPLLSDHDSRVAEAFGVAYELPESLRACFTELGHPLPDVNGTENWTLPIPATFVIAPNGVISFAHVDPDYRRRLDPLDVLRELRRLRTGEPLPGEEAASVVAARATAA